MNSKVPVEMKEKGNDIIRQWNPNLKTKKKEGDMAKSVDATDLIGLSLGMETY